MFWHFYVRRGQVFAPTVARTDTALYQDVEPVEVASTSDPSSVEIAIKKMVARGNPRVPGPVRGQFPRPVLLQYAGVDSWSAFARGTSVWDIAVRNDRFQLVPNRAERGGGWLADPAAAEEFGAGASIDEVARRVAVLVRS